MCVTKKQVEYHWNLLELEIPDPDADFIQSAVAAFGDQIVFLFAIHNWIYCLVLYLMNGLNIVIKCLKWSFEYFMNVCLGNGYVILESLDGIHFRMKYRICCRAN